MSDDAALLASIHDLPHDDLPRLAYADWLEEHGQPERAEFIRVELALDGLPEGDNRLPALRRREIDLIRAHKDEWFGTFRAGWLYYDCRRGFIEEVNSTAAAFLPHMDWLFHNHAVQRVSLTGTMRQMDQFLCHPLLGVLRSASFQNGEGLVAWSPPTPRSTIHAPLASRPLEFRLYMGAGPELVAALGRTPRLSRLGQLNLSANQIGAGLGSLLDLLPDWPLLTGLALRGQAPEPPTVTLPNIGSDGIVYLAQHPATARLRTLDLMFNRITEPAVRALADSPFLNGIEELTVGEAGSQFRRGWRSLLKERFGERVQFR